MKTSIIISAVFIGVSALALAAGESTDVKNSINPGKFYGLIVNNNANVILTQGEENSVRFEGEKNEIKKIKAEVENGALVIDGKNSRPMSIYISVKDINLIEINGSAKIFANSGIQSDILLLKINGSGSMKIDIRALTVGMIVKGDGKIVVSGSTGDSYSRIYGNGKINSEELNSFNHTSERSALNVETGSVSRKKLKLHQ